MKRKNVFRTANIRYLKLMRAYWCVPELASLHPGERAGAGRTGGRVRSPHPLPAPHLSPAKGHFKPLLDELLMFLKGYIFALFCESNFNQIWLQRANHIIKMSKFCCN